MNELERRLDLLARRGTPRGADAVLEAANSGSDGAATPGEIDDSVSDATPPDVIPFVTAEPARRRRRPFGSLIAAAGMAAVLVVGAVAVSGLLGSGGGSNSPEGAVRQLADAVSHEDPIAAADVLAPSEVGSLEATVSNAEHRAADLRLVDSASAPLRGVDLSVDGLQLSTEPLGPDVTKVTISSGTMSARTEHQLFSQLLQRAMHGAHDESSSVDLAHLADDQPTFLVAIKQDGKWYVSAAYTVLEYVREANRGPAPDFDVPPASALGADTPDAAVQDALRALSANDFNRLFSLVAPDQIPLYAYRSSLAQAIGDSRTDFTVTQLSTSSTTNGDTANVVLHASGSTSSGPWSWDGGCLHSRDPNVDTNGDTNASTSADYAYCVSGTPSVFGGLAFFVLPIGPGRGATSTTPAPIAVVRRDGRWFVNPVGTVLGLLDGSIGKVDQRTLYATLGLSQDLPADGALTLGRPVSLAGDDSPAPRVLALHGHAGERIVGAFDVPNLASGDDIESYDGGEATVYDSDGKRVSPGALFPGQVMTLPRDGDYKVVVQVYGFAPASGTFTVWHEADAPESALHPPGLGDQQCEITDDGGSMCSSSSAVSSPFDSSSATTATSTP